MTADESAAQRLVWPRMPAQHRTAARLLAIRLIQAGSDLVALWIALGLSAVLMAPLVMPDDQAWKAVDWHTALVTRLPTFMVLSLGVVLWFWIVRQHYSQRRPFWGEIREVAVVLLAAAMVDASMAFLSEQEFPRAWLPTLWGSALVILPVARWLTIRTLCRKGMLDQPYVIIGQGAEIADALLALESEPLMAFRPVALVYWRSPQAPMPADAMAQVEALAHQRGVAACELDEALIERLCEQRHIKVIFTMSNPGSPAERALWKIRQRIALSRDDIYLVPPASGVPLQAVEPVSFLSHDVMLLRATNRLHCRASRILKRLFDVVAAGSALVLLSPLLVYVAWRIRRESPGPALFVQQRIGLGGKLFPIYKFRSMVMDADKVLEGWKQNNPELWRRYVESNFKLADDPRVTPIGRLIRRTSIDELPQLLNVVLGHMSLVGPRPLLPRELEDYGDAIDVYTSVRPGISGLWQVSGRSRTTFGTRIALDRWYIRNWSLWQDVVILLRSVRVVLRSDGAV